MRRQKANLNLDLSMSDVLLPVVWDKFPLSIRVVSFTLVAETEIVPSRIWSHWDIVRGKKGLWSHPSGEGRILSRNLAASSGKWSKRREP